MAGRVGVLIRTAPLWRSVPEGGSFREQFWFRLEFYAKVHEIASPSYGKHWSS
jgi:hypothetical protein